MVTYNHPRIELLKKRSRARRLARGLTLIELMIVITLIGALMAVIAVGLFTNLAKGEKKAACIGTKNISAAAKFYMREHASATEDVCPTVDMLRAEAAKGDKIDGVDPWGKPYDIKCDGADVVVSSGGPSKGKKPDDSDQQRHLQAVTACAPRFTQQRDARREASPSRRCWSSSR